MYENILLILRRHTPSKNEQQSYQIVHIDASYMHVNHGSRKTWVDGGDDLSRGNSREGQRSIIIYAITRDGPLIAPRFYDNACFSKREEWFRVSWVRRQWEADARRDTSVGVGVGVGISGPGIGGSQRK